MSLGLYCPNAGAPFAAVVGITRDPRQPAPGGGYEPWALQVIELSADGIGEITFFLDTETLFPLFDLPARLDP